MIVLTPLKAIVAALVLALWLGGALWAAVVGWRRVRAAQATGEGAALLGALLDSAPAVPLLIFADGRIEAPERLAARLGLDRVPRFLPDLVSPESGIDDRDAAALAADIAAAKAGGAPVDRPLRVPASSRILVVRGGPAPAALGRGAVLLWLFDTTDSQREIDRLELEGARLRDALDALAALIEAAPVPMWHRGPDLRLSLVNSAYVRAVEGDSAQDVITRGLELVEGDSGRGPIAAAAEAREAGAPVMRTVPTTIGGARRMLRIVDVPLGESGVAGYAVDVEELEEARGDLLRFLRAQRDMLDRLSAGVAQFGPDRSLVFFNQPFLRLFAMQPEWLADGPEFDRVLERMREAGRVPESRDFPAWKKERRGWFMAADAAIEETWLLPGGFHLRVVAQPLPDRGLVLIFEDRTEQVKLESARDTLLRVRTATFNNLFEAIGVFASDGRLHLWNNRFRELWGLSEEELAEHPRIDSLICAAGRKTITPSRGAMIRELIRMATAERQQRSGQVTLADGRHYEFAAVPLPDGNALFTMLDITDSRQVEAALRERNEALEESDKVKSAFVANMSYELRTPLTSIGGFAEMLEGGYAGDLSDTAKEYVGAILSSVGRLGTLIDDVLDLTHSAAGGLPMAEEPVDLAALARAAAAAVGEAAARRKLDLAIDIRDDVGEVRGDARRLRQAIDNVLRNAISYTPVGGRVFFHASGDPGEARLIVSDDGEGIAPKERARVFDRFHREKGKRRGGGSALGLGLPLTRQFVEAHGGKVTLVSEVGEGTTVTIALPRRRRRTRK